MKNNIIKKIALASACIFTMSSLVACGNSASSTSTTSSTTAATESSTQSAVVESSSEEVAETTELSGSLVIVGSTSMEKLSSALAESFMNTYPDVVVNTEYVGSSAGVEAVLNGTADIGNSSRTLKDSEKEGGAIENIVAIDGIAVCVDPANTVDNLSKDDLVAIYTGTITNWNEVGGEDTPIVVVGRESGSGTRGAFEEILGDNEYKYANELDSTGAVIARVAATPGAIGYVSLDAVNDSVKALALDGVDATSKNIIAGDYFLSRPFVMATKGAIEEQSELVQAWFEYVLGEEGQTIATNVGLVAVE